MSFLSLSGLAKRYGAVTAVDGIHLALPFGSRTAIVGPSGSGKSTLLRIVAGFEAPDAGRVTLDGEVLADGAAFVPAHQRSIGFVSQDGSLFPHLSVGDNVGFGLDRRMPGREKKVLDLLDMVELDRSMQDRRPHELSGGQQQRVALARALARRPKLMLLDEPFSALDAGLRETMRKAVVEVLRRAEITALLVTHDQAEALSFADQVAVLREGRLAQFGSPQVLYFKPADPFTANFLGDAVILPAALGEGWVDCPLGRIEADTAGRSGAARIMLRPEQLRLAPLPQGGATNGHPVPTGLVTGVEFGGAVSNVAISVEGAAPSPAGRREGDPASTGTQLVVRMSSIDLPPVGAHVAIGVLGRAHVFAADRSSNPAVLRNGQASTPSLSLIGTLTKRRCPALATRDNLTPIMNK